MNTTGAISIRQATSDDIPALMAFWDQHWIKGHIMATHEPLMRWQHDAPADTPEHPANAMLAVDSDDAILGFLGYIPSTRFDPALAARNTLMLAGWRVRDDAPPALGVALLQNLRRLMPHVAIVTLGLNEEVAEIYRRLGFTTGALTHWIMPDPDYRGPLLAYYPEPPQHSLPPSASGLHLRELTRAELVGLDPEPLNTGMLPAKSPAYLATRYLDHPWYDYRVHALEGDCGIKALMVTRCAEAEGTYALRIVDYLGDPQALVDARAALHHLLRCATAQYIDFMVHGLDDATMSHAGFHNVARLQGAIVPNLFEPLVMENRPIPFAIHAPEGTPMLLCKGDGDQDRPNRLPPLTLPAQVAS